MSKVFSVIISTISTLFMLAVVVVGVAAVADTAGWRMQASNDNAGSQSPVELIQLQAPVGDTSVQV